MQSLVINSTEYTPGVLFDPTQNRFELTGESRPENVKMFYEPILTWVELYKKVLLSEQKMADNKIIFDFKVKYFNSASANFIMGLLWKFDEINKNSKLVVVNWYYNSIDIEMKETGEEFEKMLSVPFNYISYN